MYMHKNVYIIEDLNRFHSKIREVSYWHFIFVNNNAINNFDQYFSFKSNLKFKKELKELIPEKESYLILEKYLLSDENKYFIKSNDLDELIKEISFRICSNLICKMSSLDIIDSIWDPDNENFCFKINPDFVNENIVTPLDFLKNMYFLSCKYLKLKNHYKDLKRIK